MNILIWILSALLWSIWSSFRKKAIDYSTLPTNLFSILWPIMWAFIIWTCAYIFWVDNTLYTNLTVIFLVLLIVIFETLSNYLEIYVFKNTKLSELLPYQNTNKLLIVLIWFFLYYWTNNSTSIASFLIILFTMFLIVFSSIDIRKFKINKIIWLYLIDKLFSAIAWLLVWYILAKYSTITYMTVNVIFVFLIYYLITIIRKDKFNLLLKQVNSFYPPRLIGLIFWWTSFVIWLYIIESTWLLIATLISFIWLVFNIISMKFILKDNPSKKQIFLAIIVSILIWIWYYLK